MTKPSPCAVLAAALGDVEGEPPGVVAAGAGLLGRGEELADVVEQARVGGQVRPRRAADRLLVDHDEPLDALQTAGDLAAEACRTGRSSRDRRPRRRRRCAGRASSRDQLDQRLADQARLARARDAGDAREHAEREGRRRAVAGCCGVTPAKRSQPSAVRGFRDAASCAPRTDSGASATPRRRARPPAGRCRGSRRRARPRAGADVDDPVGMAHRRRGRARRRRASCPDAFSRSSARSSASVSAGCSPADGSSST